MFEKDKQIMEGLVKARLAQLLYGDVGYFSTNAYSNQDVEKAVLMISDAEKLVRQE